MSAITRTRCKSYGTRTKRSLSHSLCLRSRADAPQERHCYLRLSDNDAGPIHWQGDTGDGTGRVAAEEQHCGGNLLCLDEALHRQVAQEVIADRVVEAEAEGCGLRFDLPAHQRR